MSSLPNWKARLEGDAANAKLVLLGDSTSVEANCPYLYSRMRGVHMTVGHGLYGMTSDASHVIDGGSSGYTANGWAVDASAVDYTYADLVSDAPDLVVFSFGINDVRTGTYDQAGLEAGIEACVERILNGLPDTDVVLRVPNIFLTTDSGSGSPFNFVSPQTPEACQAYTDMLWGAYMSFEGAWPNVVVADLQTAVFGRTAVASSPLMANQIHPSANDAASGYARISDFLVDEVFGRAAMSPAAAPSGGRRGMGINLGDGIWVS